MVNLSTTILLAMVTICSAGELVIKDLNDGGNCKRPSKEGDKLKMHYTGTLASDGSQFDSSIGRGPFEFDLGAGRVIKGWDQGLSGMCPGDKRKLTIPPELGYGDRGAGAAIPGGSTLIFEVQLVGIVHSKQYSDVHPEELPEAESPHSDNENQSGENSSVETEEDDDTNSAGKHILQLSILIFSTIISVYV